MFTSKDKFSFRNAITHWYSFKKLSLIRADVLLSFQHRQETFKKISIGKISVNGKYQKTRPSVGRFNYRKNGGRRFGNNASTSKKTTTTTARYFHKGKLYYMRNLIRTCENIQVFLRIKYTT